jgi:hypothetical protein
VHFDARDLVTSTTHELIESVVVQYLREGRRDDEPGVVEAPATRRRRRQPPRPGEAAEREAIFHIGHEGDDGGSDTFVHVDGLILSRHDACGCGELWLEGEESWLSNLQFGSSEEKLLTNLFTSGGSP